MPSINDQSGFVLDRFRFARDPPGVPPLRLPRLNAMLLALDPEAETIRDVIARRLKAPELTVFQQACSKGV
jgi:hypothetical protein